MACTVCHYYWCWVCGCNSDKKWHKLFEPVCSIYNEAIFNPKMPKLIKVILGLILFCIGPALGLLIAPFILISIQINKKLNPNTYRNRRYYTQKKKKPNCCLRYIFCSDRSQTKCLLMGFFFIFIPTWLVIIPIILVICAIIFGIFIVPVYIFVLGIILKMFCYWSKTKRLDNSKLSKE